MRGAEGADRGQFGDDTTSEWLAAGKDSDGSGDFSESGAASQNRTDETTLEEWSFTTKL